jgi:hypothetical protein
MGTMTHRMRSESGILGKTHDLEAVLAIFFLFGMSLKISSQSGLHRSRGWNCLLIIIFRLLLFCSVWYFL